VGLARGGGVQHLWCEAERRRAATPALTWDGRGGVGFGIFSRRHRTRPSPEPRALKSKIFGGFYFLPYFTWLVHDLPLFTLASLFCHSLL
jgi:hypothetical protein